MKPENPTDHKVHFLAFMFWDRGTCYAKCQAGTREGLKTITCSCRQDPELAERIVADMQASRDDILRAFENGTTWRSSIHVAYMQERSAAIKRAAAERKAARRSTRLQRTQEAKKTRQQQVRLLCRVEHHKGRHFVAVAEYRQGNVRRQFCYSTDQDRDLAEKIVVEMQEHREEILRHFEAGTRWRSQVHEAPRPKPEVRSCWVTIVDLGNRYKVTALLRNGSAHRTRSIRVLRREMAERVAAKMRERKEDLIDSVASGLAWDSRLQAEIEASILDDCKEISALYREGVCTIREANHFMRLDADPELLLGRINACRRESRDCTEQERRRRLKKVVTECITAIPTIPIDEDITRFVIRARALAERRLTHPRTCDQPETFLEKELAKQTAATHEPLWTTEAGPNEAELQELQAVGVDAEEQDVDGPGRDPRGET